MNTVDEYISGFPLEVQEKLISIRNIVKDEAPDAEETIRQTVPTYVVGGKWLVHFAGAKKHVAIYLASSSIEAFADRLSDYKTLKGTIQFPLSKSLPLELIRDIVRFRTDEMKGDIK